MNKAYFVCGVTLLKAIVAENPDGTYSVGQPTVILHIHGLPITNAPGEIVQRSDFIFDYKIALNYYRERLKILRDAIDVALQETA